MLMLRGRNNSVIKVVSVALSAIMTHDAVHENFYLLDLLIGATSSCDITSEVSNCLH